MSRFFDAFMKIQNWDLTNRNITQNKYSRVSNNRWRLETFPKINTTKEGWNNGGGGVKKWHKNFFSTNIIREGENRVIYLRLTSFL